MNGISAQLKYSNTSWYGLVCKISSLFFSTKLKDCTYMIVFELSEIGYNQLKTQLTKLKSHPWEYDTIVQPLSAWLKQCCPLCTAKEIQIRIEMARNAWPVTILINYSIKWHFFSLYCCCCFLLCANDNV